MKNFHTVNEWLKYYRKYLKIRNSHFISRCRRCLNWPEFFSTGKFRPFPSSITFGPSSSFRSSWELYWSPLCSHWPSLIDNVQTIFIIREQLGVVLVPYMFPLTFPQLQIWFKLLSTKFRSRVFGFAWNFTWNILVIIKYKKPSAEKKLTPNAVSFNSN